MDNIKNIFTPFIGLQTIKFGMKREMIRELMGVNYKTFRRGASVNTTDFFNEKGIFIEYDAVDICNSIEFANFSNLFFDSKNLFNYSYSQLVDVYSKKSQNIETEFGNKSITFYDLGFGASRIDNSDEIEALLIFSKTYWDI